MRVLVVEDEPDLREVTETFLLLQGHQPLVVASGAEALDAVGTHDPDVVLLDLLMPDMDGWAVLDALRARDEVPGRAVIVISAHADSATAARALEFGCRGYLAKPFTSAELAAALATI